MKKKLLPLVIVFIIIFTTTVFAHKPYFEVRNSTLKKPIKIPNTRISYVVYGKLADSNDTDFIKVNAKKGDPFYIEATIPRIKGNTEFAPYIALIGEGINQRDKVPFELNPGVGSAVIGPVGPKYFYEKFTQTSYDIRQSIRGVIPEDGEYYIAVYSPVSGGKYGIAVGEEESFTFFDIIKFPYTYLRVKYFFNPLGTILGVAILITLIFGIYKFIKYKKRR